MIFQGVDRGFELCASQYVRRREVVACAPLEPRDDYVCESRKPAEDTCTADADCPGGRCVPDTPAVGDLVCGCKYTCVTDDDCGDGYLCECTRYDSRCVPAACRSPSDCGGLECRQWFTGCSGAFACATETDVCRMVEDCYPEGSCGLGEDGRPACVDSDSCD